MRHSSNFLSRPNQPGDCQYWQQSTGRPALNTLSEDIEHPEGYHIQRVSQLFVWARSREIQGLGKDQHPLNPVCSISRGQDGPRQLVILAAFDWQLESNRMLAAESQASPQYFSHSQVSMTWPRCHSSQHGARRGQRLCNQEVKCHPHGGKQHWPQSFAEMRCLGRLSSAAHIL